MNFFEWIRNGVKQSVLLGVSDAAEQIGGPEQTESLNQSLLKSLEEGRLIGQAGNSKSRGRRKSLGRSLSQIIDEDKKAA